MAKDLSSVENVQKYWKNIVQKIKTDLYNLETQGLPKQLTFNNYKEFCEYLELQPYSSSYSKKAQLDELSKHIIFEQFDNPNNKKTKMFVITDYFEYSLLDFKDLLEYSIIVYLDTLSQYPQINNSDTIYYKNFSEKSNKNTDGMYDFINTMYANHMVGNVSMNNFAIQLGMFSEKYNYFSNRKNQYSQKTNISKKIINDFFEKASENSSRNLEKILEHLKDSDLIDFLERYYCKDLIQSDEKKETFIKSVDKSLNSYGDYISVFTKQEDVVFSSFRYMTEEEVANYRALKKEIFLFTLYDLTIAIYSKYEHLRDIPELDLKKAEKIQKWIKKNIGMPIPNFSLLYLHPSDENFQKAQIKFKKQKDNFINAMNTNSINIEQTIIILGISDLYYSTLNNSMINKYKIGFVSRSYDIFFSPDEIHHFSKNIPAKIQASLLEAANSLWVNQDNQKQFFNLLKYNNGCAFADKLEKNRINKEQREINQIKSSAITDSSKETAAQRRRKLIKEQKKWTDSFKQMITDLVIQDIKEK